MKLADFKSEDGEVIELDFTHKDIPRKVEQNGKVYYRVFGVSIVIPENMKAGSNAEIFRYTKPPLQGGPGQLT